MTHAPTYLGSGKESALLMDGVKVSTELLGVGGIRAVGVAEESVREECRRRVLTSWSRNGKSSSCQYA